MEDLVNAVLLVGYCTAVRPNLAGQERITVLSKTATLLNVAQRWTVDVLGQKLQRVNEGPAIGRLAMAGSTAQVPSAADVILASHASGCKDSVDHCVQPDDQFCKLG